MIRQPAKLPRGRSALSRDEVERIHRERLCRAMAEAMAENGYAGTSVKDVLDRAGVSRRDFYQLYHSKLECFLSAFTGARNILLGRMLEGAGVESAERLAGAGDPVGRFGSALSAYLTAVTEEMPIARLFLVESYAAGPDAVRLRMKAQESIADAMAALMGVTGPAGRATCATVIAAVSSSVTGLLALGDTKDGQVRNEILAIGPRATGDVRRLWEAGIFVEP